MIDDSKYYLGSLCKRGHDHEGTGKSLRQKRSRNCVRCHNLHSLKWYKANPERMLKNGRYWRANNKEHSKEYRARWLKTPKGRLLIKIHHHKRRVKNSLTGKISSEIYKTVQWICDDACVYCGAKENLTLDHFVAISKGGINKPSNFVIACKSCNSSKRDHDACEWYINQPFYNPKRWYKICYILDQLKNLE